MPAIPSPRVGRRPRLEIIPFIDIMFFLLATFMMVSLSMIDNQGIDLNLPGANSAKPQDQTDHTQTVSVAKNGELFLNKEPITLDALQERFGQLITGDPEIRLVLQGDYDCPYGLVVEVFDSARTRGLNKLVIRTARPEPR
jgi:biopolymer transport protein ExbD